MFDLEAAVATWRHYLAKRRVFMKEDLDELEWHVRDYVREAVGRGVREDEAFRAAVRDVGDYDGAEAEYGKVYWGKVRRHHRWIDETIWRFTMLKNFVLVAMRNVRRHPLPAFVNVTGLAVGLACCLLIAVYVRYEWSYDRYHTNYDRIYRLVHRFGGIAVEEVRRDLSQYQVWGNAPVGPALKADFPEVAQVVQFTEIESVLLQNGDRRFAEADAFYADSTVFQVFSWPLIAGNPERALAAPYSVVLSQSTARKYFGDEDPIGETLISDNQDALTVTGVMEDVPPNSHFTFDLLLSMSTLRQLYPEDFESWGYVDYYTYFLVSPGVDTEALATKLPDFVSRNRGPDSDYAVAFEPLSAAYLHSPAARQPGRTGSVVNLYVFSAVAVFVLLIACINFVNLSTARSAVRAKEVGVRKVVGADRSSLVRQFLAESVLMSVLALVLALGLAAAGLPAFRSLAGSVIGYGALFDPGAQVALFAVSILVGLLAGIYPALVLTRFRPAVVLKGAFRSTAQGVLLRKGLVVFQFCLSVAFIAGTAIVYSQLDYLRHRDLGFEHEQMLLIDFGYDMEVQQQIEPIKAALLEHPAVRSATASRNVPGSFYANAYTPAESATGETQDAGPGIFHVDYDYLSTYGIDVVAGRYYDRAHPADTAQAMVLNEAATRMYGYARPEDAVGRGFEQWGREGTIIGVVEDFNFRSLHTPVEPLTLRLEPSGVAAKFLTLRIDTERLPETLADLERLWAGLAPQRPFQYSFLDDDFNRQYQADERFGEVFGVFAGLAIFIACLGLFGLVVFTAERRTKEIGVRKVLGASVPDLVLLLSKEFVALVGIGFVLAVPLTYWPMSRWLDAFAYRVDLGAGVFLLAGALTLFIALATVGYRAVRAASADPVDSLRYE